MKLSRNLFTLFSFMTFAGASVILSFFNYNPYQANNGILINFYVSLFVFLASFGGIALYYAKILIGKNEKIYTIFWPSVRQATFVAVAISTLLYLQSLRILDWLIGISVCLVTILLELFFESKKHIKPKKNE